MDDGARGPDSSGGVAGRDGKDLGVSTLTTGMNTPADTASAAWIERSAASACSVSLSAPSPNAAASTSTLAPIPRLISTFCAWRARKSELVDKGDGRVLGDGVGVTGAGKRVVEGARLSTSES